MSTLEEARDWYLATVNQVRILRRLGDKHWDGLDWKGPLGQDEKLRLVERVQIAEQTDRSLRPLADLAVLVLFSVFEAVVRDQIETRIKPEADGLRDPTLQKAAGDVLEAVAHGSFGRLLEPYKGLATADLVEQVNRVRRYRNWVAHGRRGTPRDEVTPEAAYERLGRFLALAFPPTSGG